MSTTAVPEKLGHCPYCGTTLRTYRDPEMDRLCRTQVCCHPKCRNVEIPDCDVTKWGSLRRAWEIEVGLRSKWSST